MTAQYAYTVYPAIGIARVGNSDEYYLAPETANGLPIPLGGGEFTETEFRDSRGRLRRQAARFRVYRTTLSGEHKGEVHEVTLADDTVQKIEWTVHLANKKAAWYEFRTRLGQDGYASNHPWRNADITDRKGRQDLIIDPGSRTISGRNQSATFSRRPAGEGPSSFPPETIKPGRIDTLGEIRTDDRGRLHVLGGYGHSGSRYTPKIGHYANNDGWWDDTADGPVRATIVLTETDGNGRAVTRSIEATSAWVTSTPPRYAPQIAHLVTLYDTIFDTAVRFQGLRPDIYANADWNENYRPSFTREIRPILDRAALFPWVAAIPPKVHDFDVDRLGNPDHRYNALRQYYFDAIRGPNQQNTLISAASGSTLMPYMPGDDALESSQLSSKYLKLTDTQYFLLEQWAKGHFDGTNDEAAPSEHPGEALTRITLEHCIGGPFNPGIEATWIVRNPKLYSEPFRIKARPAGNVSFPLSLDLDLDRGLEPGDLSKFMAIPWQADFNECSAQPVGDRILWWWPSHRPNFVYLRPPLPLREMPTAQDKQVPWIGTDHDQHAPDFIAFADDLEMVDNWHKLGFVFKAAGEQKFFEVQRILARDNPILDPLHGDRD